MSLPLPLDPGTLLDGRYIVGTLINSGGFGAVYRGIDTSEANRPCAIKETYDVTPSARRQALTEAGILFTVRSKHLPQIYDAFGANGRFYIVMQLIEGQNLQQLLKTRRSPCSQQEVITWLLPIMQVLQELHNRTPAIIHRDIKPGNIILTPDQTAIVVDFGLTKLYDPDSNTQTMVKAVSEGFSPIEQYVGKTSPQSDIYSLAATMYFLLTMKSPPLSINRSLREELIAPRLLNPTVSPQVERALLRALAVNAEQRYQSMREFALALQEPAFNAHADPTIVATSVQSANGNTGFATLSGPAVNVQYPPPPPPPYTPAAYNAASYPVPSLQSGAVPPGYVLVPQSALTPLPSSFGQGCLWGLVQGILAALMVLILKHQAYFYLAILTGFLFYILAGFRTTHKGGSLWRGGWAGFWSGITSTIVFWIVYGIGLLFLISQRINADTQAAQRQGTVLSPAEISRVIKSVAPIVSNHPTAQSLQTIVPVFLIGGLALAVGFGLLGGLIGKLTYGNALKKGKRI
jgi:serine/threonine protein kinase